MKKHKRRLRGAIYQICEAVEAGNTNRAAVCAALPEMRPSFVDNLLRRGQLYGVLNQEPAATGRKAVYSVVNGWRDVAQRKTTADQPAPVKFQHVGKLCSVWDLGMSAKELHS